MFAAQGLRLSDFLSCATLAFELLMADQQTAYVSPPADSATQISPGPENEALARRARSEWILLHIGFVAVGIITTLIGVVLPTFIHRWSLADSQAGFLIAAQFSGSTIGTLLTSVLLPRFGFARVLGAGFFAFGAGFVFLGVGPWIVAAVSVFVYGFGYGLVNPATNLRGTQLPSKNVASAVSFLNLSWTIGAVSCPFVVAQMLPRVGIRGIAIFLAVTSFLIAALHFRRYSPLGEPAVERPTRSISEWLQHLGHAPSVSLVLIFFLYVGTEVGTGSWVATQEKRLPGGAATVLLLAPSFFYGFLLLGRAVSPLLLRRFSTISISIAGLVSAAAGSTLIILARDPRWLFAGAALAGLGCAPQYPIYVTWLAQTFGKNSNWLSALFFAAAGAGGAALPWLMGIVGARTDSLRIGFALPLMACLLMIFFAIRSYPRARTT
jgi:MFS transporter, FHS family, glucose/mannose:H+ symporter